MDTIQRDNYHTLNATLSEINPNPETALLIRERDFLLYTALQSLPDRDQYVLEKCFRLDGSDLSLRKIGETMHVSATRVGQLRDKALGRAKNKIISLGLMS